MNRHVKTGVVVTALAGVAVAGAFLAFALTGNDNVSYRASCKSHPSRCPTVTFTEPTTTTGTTTNSTGTTTVVTTTSSTTTVTQPPPVVTAPLLPTSGAYLGAYVSVDLGTTAQFETLIGHKLAVVNHFIASNGRLDSSVVLDDAANKRIPMISTLGFSGFPGLDAINNGSFDTQLHAWALQAKTIAVPFFLRIMWEMNGSWTPYSVSSFDPATGSSNTAAEYISAWRHVVDVLRGDGATNAAMVWCPHWQGKPAGVGSWRQYYPGDAYVDWVCLDGYNSDVAHWKNLAPIIGYGIYSDYASSKPIMVGETGVVEDPATAGRKGQWISQAGTDIQTLFPDVRALVWFNKNYSGGSDYRVNSSTSSLDAFKNLAAKPYFQASG